MDFNSNSSIPGKLLALGLALVAPAMLSGCQELNLAVDRILGLQSPVFASAYHSPTVFLLDNPGAGAQSHGLFAAKNKSSGANKYSEGAAAVEKGKRRKPGTLAPGMGVIEEKRKKRTVFTVERDPFRQPTEILPSECPPSTPLCRFDRSQLKLVGVIQVNEGEFKGMVEDPDGRGYFVTPGMQIGGATVTQVSNKGVTLHVHKSKTDVLIPLFREPKEGEEF